MDLGPATGLTFQIAALPFRLQKGRVSTLIITSRTRRRWIIPKGRPISGLSLAEAAAQEALEEAGVVGRIGETPLGDFTYLHMDEDGAGRPTRVEVFPLHVTEHLPDWKEKHQREFEWVSLKRAAKRLDDKGLRALIDDLRQAKGKKLRKFAEGG